MDSLLAKGGLDLTDFSGRLVRWGTYGTPIASRRAIPTVPRESGRSIHSHVMDFADLSFPDNAFDAVWALNCLLHVPKAELPTVLAEIRRVLKPGSLFFIGVYGGVNSEDIWEHDSYEPKRIFSFFENDDLQETLADWFTIVSFKTLPHTGELVFQSVVMTRG